MASAHGASISWRGGPRRAAASPAAVEAAPPASASRARDVFGHAAVDQVGADLTRLAEATLECALEAVDPQVRDGDRRLRSSRRRRARLRQRPRRRLRARRRRRGRGRAGRGRRPPLRRWRHAGRAHLGRRRRPPSRGSQRPAVAHAATGWEGYLARWVSTWERQAYLRARAVAGDADLGAQLVARLRRRRRRAAAHRRRRARGAPHEGPHRAGAARAGRRPRVPPEARAGARCRTSSSPCSCSSCGTVWSSRRRWWPWPPWWRRGHLPLEEAEVLEESYRFCEGTRNRTFLVVGSGDALPTRPELRHPRRPLARASPSPSCGSATAGSPGGPGGWWSGASMAGGDRVWAMMSAVRPLGPDDRRGRRCRCTRRFSCCSTGWRRPEGPPLDEMSLDDAREVFRGLIALDQPEEVTRVDDRLIPGDGHDVPVRVYTPADAVGGNAPLLIWIHGGGWVIGDLDTADATARALANRSGAVTVSVDYRLAPEHPAPAAARGLPGRAHLVRRERRAASASTPAGSRWAATRPAATSPRASASGCATTSAPTSTSSSSCTRSPTARCSSPSMDENAEGYFLTKAGDGVVRRPLRRRRRPEGSRRCPRSTPTRWRASRPRW